jgi:hypothetical protein
MLENIYEVISESTMMYGIELWGVYDAWKEIDKIHGRFCKKVLGVPRCAANEAAEIELVRDSRTGKTMRLTLKYWQRILRMDNQESVKKCYDWQKDNIKSDSWAKIVKEELEKIDLASIWQNQNEHNNSAMYRMVKGRCDDIERLNLFSRLCEKISLVFYQEMKQECGTEEYIDCSNRTERRGLAWWRLGIWKLRGIGRVWKKERVPMFREGRDQTRFTGVSGN